MVFLHGWPGIGLLWRAQMEAFALEGWHCIAPDMRGYGGSSTPIDFAAYGLNAIVDDMIDLHDHLGGSPAVWVGHDLGSPIAGALAAHHARRCRGIVLVSVPFMPGGFALPNLVPLVDRGLYPADRYPNGQWDYYSFYLTHFDQATNDFDVDIPASLAAIYRRGDPSQTGRIGRSATVTQNGGWFGSRHRAPAISPDPDLWPPEDFQALVETFRLHGFRPGNAWYLNDPDNVIYARAAPNGGRLNQPVLFLNGDFDGICNISRGRLGEPMREACKDLTIADLSAGHWLPLECKTELIQQIRSWLNTHALR